MPTPVQLKIQQLAERLGTKVNFVRKIESFQYDGNQIFSRTVSNAVHDIAHFQVCSPERRHLIDFGLCKGLDSAEIPPDYFNPGFESVADEVSEEVRASMLGIAWEFHLGMRWKTTSRNHNWDSNPFLDKSNLGFFSVVSWLEDRKLITDGKPNLAVRQESDRELFGVGRVV